MPEVCHNGVLGLLVLSPLPLVLSESWVKSRGAGGGQLISSHVMLTQRPRNACKWILCVFKKSAVQIEGGKRGGKKKKDKIPHSGHVGVSSWREGCFLSPSECV